MKAIQIRQPGAPSVMEYVDLPTPSPGPGQVLVRAHTIGVGIPDVLIRTGVYNWMPSLPAIMGIEVTGTVEAVGPGVQSIRPGQPVVVYQTGGCYAQAVVAKQTSVFPLPDGVDLEAAVTLPINYQTAYNVLHPVARAGQGQTAIIYAAAGGVGSALLQLAKLAGLTIIAVVSTDEKTRFVQSQGADHVVKYRTERVADRIAEITGGRGVDIVFTPVAGETLLQNFDMLAPFGQVVLYGRLNGWPPSDVFAVMRDRIANAPGLKMYSTHLYDDKLEARAELIGKLINLLAEGAIRPQIDRRLPLAEAARAHEILESGAVIGKLVLDP